jgi:adenosylcobinamide kinase/adenosylcobinamide-phosphate guanylyltransferase
MRVLLLGTGSADGWPNPWCSCASCEVMRRDGVVRRSTSALVDGRLLLDCGPDAPHQAQAAGTSLHDVRTVLLTHAHHDHLAPAALLSRSWTGTDTPLVVAGPRAATDACRDWLGPHDPVSLLVLEAGDVVELDGYVVRALESAHDVGRDALTVGTLLYDVTAPDGSRLLYATDTAALPQPTLDATAGAAYDVVLLEETFGRTTDHGTGHHDLATFPVELARLRATGAVVPSTAVVAVHLSHHNPPDLDRVLAAWGVQVLPDLTVLDTTSPAHLDAPPRRRLVLGGARSGKSREAERSLAAAERATYVATAGLRGGDPEWDARVQEHRARRPSSWRTLETLDIATTLTQAAAGEAVLVDCLSLWLAGRLDEAGVWEHPPGSDEHATAVSHVDAHVDRLVAAVRTTPARVELVSNEVGSGVVPEHASGRLYRDLLGKLNARVAAECDEVVLVVAGRVVAL